MILLAGPARPLLLLELVSITEVGKRLAVTCAATAFLELITFTEVGKGLAVICYELTYNLVK